MRDGAFLFIGVVNKRLNGGAFFTWLFVIDINHHHEKYIFYSVLVLISLISICRQKPCSRPEYRQFDFWIGEWEAFGLNGQKAGDSKISLILDSCVILEEWTSASVQPGHSLCRKKL